MTRKCEIQAQHDCDGKVVARVMLYGKAHDICLPAWRKVKRDSLVLENYTKA